ncbi:MobP2 family relaxase [Enterococcus faecium]|nr:MobP2 family relaxase [Enterococcus faecium]
MSSSPGIIMTVKFARPGSSAFQSYIDYMDREEAVRNESYDRYSAFTNREGTGAAYEGDEDETLEGYIHYMANPVKTSRLFSADKHQLNEEDLKRMKEQFTAAAKNGSVMWQDVFSFDNQWLVQHGYLDEQTNQLKEEKIHEAIRLAMATMLTEEKMVDSAVWTASIHYNTDNIHVHVATVEPYPTREKKVFVDQETGELVTEVKGYRSRKTMRKMKSVFANQLLGLQKERAKIDVLRKVMIEGIRSDQGQEQLHDMLIDLQCVAEKLPEQKGYQKYGYAEKYGFKKELDKVIQSFIDQNFPELYQEMMDRQAYIQSEEESAFGEGRNSSENKLHTLYTRLGNHILKEIQAMDLVPKKRQVNGSLGDVMMEDQSIDRDKIIEENQTKSAEAFQLALERIVNNPARHRANEPPVLESLLAYICTEEEKISVIEEESDEREQYKQELKKEWKLRTINNQRMTIQEVEESNFPPMLKKMILTSSRQETITEEVFDEQIEYFIDQCLPKSSEVSEYQKEFVKSLKESVEKIENNPFQHKENEPPTAEEWHRYFQSLEQSIPTEDSYDHLFQDQAEEVRSIYQRTKESSEKQAKWTKKRRFPLSKKERAMLQKQWQKEVAKRKQVYQLQRVLRENTEQWRNERFYERNILDLSV